MDKSRKRSRCSDASCSAVPTIGSPFSSKNADRTHASKVPFEGQFAIASSAYV